MLSIVIKCYKTAVTEAGFTQINIRTDITSSSAADE